jgi:hypothetical protein
LEAYGYSNLLRNAYHDGLYPHRATYIILEALP